MAVRTAYAPVAGEVLTAANLSRLPGGWIGYNEVTADQVGIGTTITDLTGLAVTVTVGTSRRIRVTSRVQVKQNTSAGTPVVYIREGASILQSNSIAVSAANFIAVFETSVVLTPTPGSHAYKLSALTSANTVDSQAAAANPAFILVEDIGSAS